MTTRRGNGEGSIFQRGDGIWTATFNIGYDERGKRRRRTVYGKTKREVQDKLTRLQSDSLNGLLVDNTRLTIAQFLAQWLEGAVKPSVRESTYINYERVVRNKINPVIGGMPLNKVTAAHVQGLYATMAKGGASPRYRELTHAVLNRALNQALKWNLVSRNVCNAVDKPRVSRKSFKVLDPEEVSKLLRASTSDRLHVLYILAITSGLRQGELLALHWHNIDLNTALVAVVHTLLEHGGRLSLGEPKSASGRRSVHIPEFAVTALKAHRDRMMAEGHGSEWVFCDTLGGPLRKSNLVRRSFHPILKSAGLPRIRFHDLRHTAATLLLKQGVHAKVVQERLGHSQISLTLDTYSHVLPSMQRDAADKLDSLFTDLES